MTIDGLYVGYEHDLALVGTEEITLEVYLGRMLGGIEDNLTHRRGGVIIELDRTSLDHGIMVAVAHRRDAGEQVTALGVGTKRCQRSDNRNGNFFHDIVILFQIFFGWKSKKFISKVIVSKSTTFLHIFSTANANKNNTLDTLT